MWVAWIKHQRGSTIKIGKQPFDRPRAEDGEAVLDLPHLLSGMDMNRTLTEGRDSLAQCIGRNGPERMRRNADTGLGQIADDGAAALDEPVETIDVVEKPPLSVDWRLPTDAAAHVERRQQRQPYSGHRCC
jgi:hypothetical protein